MYQDSKNHQNQKADCQILYKKYGFEQISVRKNYYNDDDAIIMNKIL